MNTHAKRPLPLAAFRRLFARALLLALLLAGQWALLAHALDLHAHEDGGACEVCLVAQALGGPVGQSHALRAPTRAVLRQPHRYDAVSLFAGPTAAHAPIRAPPAVLS